MALGELFQKLSFGYVCWVLLAKPQRRNFAYNYCYRDFCKQKNLISLVVCCGVLGLDSLLFQDRVTSFIF